MYIWKTLYGNYFIASKRQHSAFNQGALADILELLIITHLADGVCPVVMQMQMLKFPFPTEHVNTFSQIKHWLKII